MDPQKQVGPNPVITSETGPLVVPGNFEPFSALQGASLEGGPVGSVEVGALLPNNAMDLPEATAPSHNPKHWLRFGLIGFALLVCVVLVFFHHQSPDSPVASNIDQQYATQTLPLNGISSVSQNPLPTDSRVNINGQLNVGGSLVLTPMVQPSNAVTGQLYYDQTTGQLSYFDGTSFVNLLTDRTVKPNQNPPTTVQQVHNTYVTTGVLSLQGQTGNISLGSGNGIALSGTTITNTGVLSVGGQTGNITLGSGLGFVGGQLRNTGVVSVTAGSNISINNDGNGNLIINAAGAGSSVTGSGTGGTLALWNGSGTVSDLTDSLLSQSGGAVTVAGTLSATALIGNGSGVTNVNAVQLGGQASSYYTNASNIDAGTIGDSYLSSNVALYNRATSNFTGTLQHNGHNVCDTTGNCGYSGSGTGSGVASVNSLVGDLTLQGTAGQLSFASGGSTITAALDPNVTLLGQSIALGSETTGNYQQFTTAGDGITVSGSPSAGSNPTIAVDGTVCRTSGNCTGVSGGAIGGSGTANTIALFTGSGYTIGNSLLTQSGSTVSVAGTLSATSLSGDGSGVTNVNATQLGGQAGSYYTNATNLSTGILSDSRLSSNVTLQGNTFNGANQLLQLDGSGLASVANGGTGVNGSTAGNGQLLIGNGSGYQLGSLGSGSGISISTGTGTISIAVDSTVCRTSNNCTATGAAGGDLQGTYPSPTIAKLQGTPFSLGTLASGDALQYDGTSWVNGHITNSNLAAGSFGNITGVGALAAGSISTGFGAISTGNNISTTAAFQGGSESLTGTNSLALGTASTNAGSIKFYSSLGSGSVTVNLNNPGTNNFTLSIPTLTASTTICVSTGNCTASGTAGGDLSGNYPNPLVAKLQGNPISLASLSTGDVLQYNGTNIVNGKVTNTNLQSGSFPNITTVGTLTGLTVTGQSILGGGTNQTQLIIKANSGQSSGNPLIVFQSSTGAQWSQLNVDSHSNIAFGNNSQAGMGGSSNNSVGGFSLFVNTGSNNNAFGYGALSNSTSGSNNTAVGSSALNRNITGSANTALGYYAGGFDSQNQFATLSNLQNSTALGAYAQVQASNTMVLGSVDTATQVVVGATVPIGSNSFGVSPVDLNSITVTASQANGNGTITASAAIFSAANVGEELVWADGTTETITGYTDSTHVTGSSITITETNSYFRTHHIGFQVTNTGNAYIQNTSTTAFQVQNATGTQVLGIDTVNGAVLITSTSNSTIAFKVTDSSGSPVIVVDTANHRLGVNTATPGTTLSVNGGNNINPSWPDGLVGTPISKAVTMSTTYTVPTGNTLYLTSFYTSGTGNLTDSANYVYAPTGGYTSFPNPILVAAGTVLQISASGTGYFTGLLVPSGVSPTDILMSSSGTNTIPAGRTFYLTGFYGQSSGTALIDTSGNVYAYYVSGSAASFGLRIPIAAGTVLKTSSSNPGFMTGYYTNNNGLGGP